MFFKYLSATHMRFRRIQTIQISANLCSLTAVTPRTRIHGNRLKLLSNTKPISQCGICTSYINLKSVPIAVYEEIKSLPKHPEKLLVDVREPQELSEVGKIPTSINIPLSSVCQELGPDVPATDFEAKYGRKKPQMDTEIIFSCLKGKRSLQAAEFALGLGYGNVKSYEGSWQDWAKHEA